MDSANSLMDSDGLCELAGGLSVYPSITDNHRIRTVRTSPSNHSVAEASVASARVFKYGTATDHNDTNLNH